MVRLSALWIAGGNARKWLVSLRIAGICTSGEEEQMGSETAEWAQRAAPRGKVKRSQTLQVREGVA